MYCSLRRSRFAPWLLYRAYLTVSYRCYCVIEAWAAKAIVKGMKKTFDTFSLITLMFLITVFTAVFTAALFLAATAAAAALVVTVLSLEVDPAQLSE